MTKMVFINLPVADLVKAKAFYAALGFVNEPRFTDETAAAMQWSDAIVVMLLTHPKWQSFTTRPISDRGSSEVMLALSVDSKHRVNMISDMAGANGGSTDPNPTQDHGFMFGRSFLDLDGHLWETMWMDPAMIAQNGQASQAATHERVS